MASIFLSYDREDVARARPVASLLERSGHSVWWDRRIRGGREFAAEIEAALEAADRIVVLWSARAVKSAWVRDEAAVGRDSGRLVPATLDGTPPPLGFRQFQTIDLSKAKWRGRSPQLEELVEALETSEQADPEVLPRPHKEPSALRRPLLLGVVIIALLAVIGATAAWLWRSAETSAKPRIAIISGDSSPLSRQVTRDLVLMVPNLPGADASAYQLVDAPRSSSSADAVLTIAGSSSGGHERRDLVLRAPNQAILWSASIQQPSSTSGTLPQQLAVEAQRALLCAAEALTYRREPFGQDTLRVYLAACTGYDYAFANEETAKQISLFEQVIAKAPHFVPAWAKMLTLDLWDIESGNDRHARLLATRAHIQQADRLNLHFGELEAARRVWISPTDFIGLFRNFNEAISRYPNNATVRRLYAERSWNVGRMGQAVSLASAAVQLDPLSSANQQILIIAYAYAGDLQGALRQLQKAEKLFPGAPGIAWARYAFNLRYGDPKVALALAQSSVELGGLSTQQAAFLRARIDPSPANIERAIAEDRLIYEQDPNFIGQITQTLAQFGRKDEVIEIMLHYGGGPVAGLESQVLFRPAFRDVWRDPRSMAAAARLGLLYYWKTSGDWPDFCSDPTLPYDCKKEAAKYHVENQKFTVAPAKK
jgi:tetratricopeptide (TPR) repeat protein